MIALAGIANALSVVTAVATVLDKHPSPWWGISLALCCGGAITSGILFIDRFRGVKGNKVAAPAIEKPVLSISEMKIDDQRNNPDLKLFWPLKIRIYLHNELSEPIYATWADWIANSQQAQLHVHPEGGIGWQFIMPGVPESRKAFVAPGGTVEMYWGISTAYDISEVRRKWNSKQLGTLVIFATVSGKETEIRLAI